MAFPKKGTRRLVVDGTAYLWRVRRKLTYEQYWSDMRLAIRAEGQKPGLLVLILPGQRHDAGSFGPSLKVTPIEVATWVREALAAGWEPSVVGQHEHRPKVCQRADPAK